MIESLASSTTAQGELIEQSLRYAMHSRSLDLLGVMVHSLADQKDVENVMILDKKGAIRFSSDPEDRGRVLARSDPTCNICHLDGPSIRGRTVEFETKSGMRVFRNVNPILNSESCFECHSPDDKANGVLIVDYSMAGIESSLKGSAGKMWLSAIILAVAITGTTLFFMRRLVLLRLGKLVRVVDSYEAGRLHESVDIKGVDEISLLSRHLSRMAKSLDRSMTSLREREAFLDAVINSANDGIVVIDDQMRIVTANRAFETLLGDTPKDLALGDCDCSKLCALHDPGDCPARLTFDSGHAMQRIRTIMDDDGRARHFEIFASPLKNPPGNSQVLEVWRDITQRRELEAQLANSERLASLGILASGLSHEINNPLASITTCLDGLRRRLCGGDGSVLPEELPEYLELIRREVGRVQDLTERLKVLGRKPLQVRQWVDLNAVVQDILFLVRYEAERNAVEIEEHLTPDLRSVVADEAQVRQVVLNVVLNAIQALEGPGWIRVSTRRTVDGFNEVEVTDSGPGIVPSDRERIFEPFYSTRPGGRGTGLGLFITKIIVGQLGGAIRVSSDAGKGAKFTITLPTETIASVMTRHE
jgi:PAS domain S-box-containing protein